jgi:hypothetical protein
MAGIGRLLWTGFHMLVRVRIGSRRTRFQPRFQNAALATASLLAPSSLVAFTVSFWGFAADLQWTGDFFISRGVFAHWQVWMAMAAVLLLISRLLDGYAQKGQPQSTDSNS